MTSLTEILMPTHTDLSKLLSHAAPVDPCRHLIGGSHSSAASNSAKRLECGVPVPPAAFPDTIPPQMRDTLILIIGERLRQTALVESEILPFNCADPEIENLLKLPVLTEEHGEVGKALYELTLFDMFARGETIRADLVKNLHTELIQLAAVATAWAESLQVPNQKSQIKNQK